MVAAVMGSRDVMSLSWFSLKPSHSGGTTILNQRWRSRWRQVRVEDIVSKSYNNIPTQRKTFTVV